MKFQCAALCLFAIVGCHRNTPCEPLCGADMASFSKRCEEAFGDNYSCPVAQNAPPDADCESLSGFSPGLKLNCDGTSVDVFCCEYPRSSTHASNMWAHAQDGNDSDAGAYVPMHFGWGPFSPSGALGGDRMPVDL